MKDPHGYASCSSANRDGVFRQFTLRDYSVEFFPLLKRREKRQRFAVRGYRSRQTMERWRVFRRLASCYLGIR